MQEIYEAFNSINEKNIFKKKNNHFNDFINKFTFLMISKSNFNIILNQIKPKLKILIIDSYQISNDEEYLIFTFDDTLIIIDSKEIDLIKEFFNQNKFNKIFSLNQKSLELFFEINDEIEEGTYISMNDPIFQLEIEEFLNNLDIDINSKYKTKFWTVIKRSITGYLIQKSYVHARADRDKNKIDFFKPDSKEILFKNDEFIELENIGFGLSSVKKIFHIEKQIFYASKIILTENNKLFNREHDNYLKIHHPFIPKYYGLMKSKLQNSLII